MYVCPLNKGKDPIILDSLLRARYCVSAHALSLCSRFFLQASGGFSHWPIHLAHHLHHKQCLEISLSANPLKVNIGQIDSVPLGAHKIAKPISHETVIPQWDLDLPCVCVFFFVFIAIARWICKLNLYPHAVSVLGTKVQTCHIVSEPRIPAKDTNAMIFKKYQSNPSTLADGNVPRLAPCPGRALMHYVKAMTSWWAKCLCWRASPVQPIGLNESLCMHNSTQVNRPSSIKCHLTCGMENSRGSAGGCMR